MGEGIGLGIPGVGVTFDMSCLRSVGSWPDPASSATASNTAQPSATNLCPVTA